jgi:calcineurin-like phosphoesterase family protein
MGNRDAKRPPASRRYDVMLHGHTHSRHVYTAKDVIHVGVDAHDFAPISFERMHDIVQYQTF